MNIVKEIVQKYDEHGSPKYRVTIFKNKYGIFLYDAKDQNVHRWSDSNGWVFICREISDLDEAQELVEDMFGNA